jgi:superoxide reductase
MKKLGDLIYTPESARGEAVSKVESHTPKIEAPDRVKTDQPFTVRVTVGPHPNLIEHSIRRIEVFLEEDGRPFNPVILAAMSLTPVYSEPDVKLNVKLKKGGTIHAIEYCNVHGLWEGIKVIKVTD